MAIEQEYCGARGRNYFKEDQLAQKLLKEILPESIRAETFERLEKFGELCGGKIASLVEAAHQDGKYAALKKYDRWGKRIDKVLYCPEQLEARRLALKAGVLPPTPLIERMTMAYLLNQNGEGGITCPLAMTDGLADLLEERGSDEQKQKYLPLLRDPATQTPLTGGQFVTEQQGGSNVSENETLAEEAPDGTWRLTGLKWFCSNPGELWVTTAKPKGSSHVGLFLVPRRLPGGELNEAHILRLKDLSGTRGKATAEVEYRGARAEMIGRPLQGISILLSSVLKTSRIHVAAASLGFIRRAYWEPGASYQRISKR
jgi:putative acyl-CoA dehydrogenase